GLKDALEVLRDVDGVGFTFFEAKDVVRHPLVARIVDAYDSRDQRTAEPGPASRPAAGRGGVMTRGPVILDVAVSYALPRTGIPAASSFRTWVAAALHGRIREADLAVRLVDEDEGRALNRHYRGKDYATNVLSFPAELPEGVK